MPSVADWRRRDLLAALHNAGPGNGNGVPPFSDLVQTRWAAAPWMAGFGLVRQQRLQKPSVTALQALSFYSRDKTEKCEQLFLDWIKVRPRNGLIDWESGKAPC